MIKQQKFEDLHIRVPVVLLKRVREYASKEGLSTNGAMVLLFKLALGDLSRKIEIYGDQVSIEKQDN